jgi:hypothetical protein
MGRPAALGMSSECQARRLQREVNVAEHMTNARCPRRPHALTSLYHGRRRRGSCSDDPAPCVGTLSARVPRLEGDAVRSRNALVAGRNHGLVGQDSAIASRYCTGTAHGYTLLLRTALALGLARSLFASSASLTAPWTHCPGRLRTDISKYVEGYVCMYVRTYSQIDVCTRLQHWGCGTLYPTLPSTAA